MMALSGVRSSWDMLARNSDLCRSAISSCSVFSRSSLEQAHVLDGDHRLVGEGPEQLDLLLQEGAGPGRVTRRALMASSPRSMGTHSPLRNP